MNGLEHVKENIKTEFDGEPVELVQDGGDVTDDRGSGDDTWSLWRSLWGRPKRRELQ